MKRKAEFLEEVCRILKPGGVALLQIGESNWNYPYSQACDERILTPYTSRFILKHGPELIPLPVYVKLFEGDRFLFRFITDSRCTIIVCKLRPGLLSLQLAFNWKLSGPMHLLPYRGKSGQLKDGFRSVYDVCPKLYETLFERGLLSHDQISR
jgi:hypothetical protein